MKLYTKYYALNLHSSLDRWTVMDFVKIYLAVVSLSYGSVYMYVFYI